jgi:hypothetical protein
MRFAQAYGGSTSVVGRSNVAAPFQVAMLVPGESSRVSQFAPCLARPAAGCRVGCGDIHVGACPLPAAALPGVCHCQALYVAVQLLRLPVACVPRSPLPRRGARPRPIAGAKPADVGLGESQRSAPRGRPRLLGGWYLTWPQSPHPTSESPAANRAPVLIASALAMPDRLTRCGWSWSRCSCRGPQAHPRGPCRTA